MRQKTCGPFHSSQNLPLAFINFSMARHWANWKEKKIKPTCILGLILKLTMKVFCQIQSNLMIRNCLIRNKFVLRNHFLWPICHLLHKNTEVLALRNNFRATKKFLVTYCTRFLSCDFRRLTLKDMGRGWFNPLVRRTPVISYRIILWSQNFLTLCINIPSTR